MSPDTTTDTTLWQRFAEVVARQPERIAVHDAARTWTYAELHTRAEAIAALLDASEAGERVACALTHGGEMIAGVLGVLAGGRAYVPLDATHPLDRSTFVLHDSGARTLLCDRATAAFAARLGDAARVIHSDEAVDGRRPAHRPAPADVAYCLYTSGSTGRPKGVLQRHAHVVHLLDGYRRRLELGPTDVVTLLSTFAFDAAVVDVFSTLLAGATLVPFELRARGLAELPGALAARGVTIYHSTPTVWRELVARAPTLSSTIRAVVLGGEEVVAADLARLRAACAPSAILVNGYGMTECSWALLHVVSPGEELARPTVPLGAPLDGVRVTLKTPFGVQRTINGVGTICIESPYVAAGYHARPDETAAAFPKPGVYLTSDLGRLLPGGQIEFAGRLAHQVKLRGFRIDLRELEAVLATTPGVAKAAAAVHDGPRGPELVAYIVADGVADGVAPSSAAVREHLAATLPDYMVPAVVVPLAALPLGPTGKLDRNALPAPDAAALTRASFVAPRDPIEEAVATIWAGLLGVDQVSVHDDFFALGGHSLLATRLIAMVQAQLDVELPVRAVFDARTVTGLAAEITRRRAAGVASTLPPLVAAPRAARPPLSFAQERLWFLHQLEPESTAYAIENVRRLAGADVEALRRAFELLVARHESLRTSFPAEDGVPYQLVHAAGAWSLPVEDARGLDADDQAAVIARVQADQRRPFDLAAGPLLRTTLVRVADDVDVLVVRLHHIITDGWSQDVLWRELWTYYDALAAGHPVPELPPLPVQVADYAAWQRTWLAGTELDRHLAFWTTRLHGAPEDTALPFHGPSVATPSAHHADARVEAYLDAGTSAALRALAQREGATLFMVLLAGFRALLARVTGQEDLVIGTPIANRRHRELEVLIGFFVNTLALRGEVHPEDTFTALLAREKAATLGAYDHQDAPFELVVDALHLTRRLDRSPLFQTWFVHQNLPSDAPARGEQVTAAAAQGGTKFDLAVYSFDAGDKIGVAWRYSPERFDAATIRALNADYQALLAEVAAHPERRLDALLPDATPAAPRATGDDATLWARFAEVAARQPSRIAVHDATRAWTYAELLARADAIAALLDDAGAGDRVACALAHGGEMIAGVLGVLAGGRAYVPLDPTHPRDRSAFVLADSGARTVLCDATTAAFAAQLDGVRVVRTDDAREGRHPVRSPQPHDLAYCLYTSGSTGRPKGVLQRHAHVVHLLDAYSARLALGAADVVTLLSTLAFDAAVVDVFSTLLAGATLCTYELRARGLADLAGVLAARGVTIYHSTPTVWRELVALAPALSPTIRAVVLGGEEVVADDVVKLRAACAPSTLLINGYGMTECSWALLHDVRPGDTLDRTTVPLGTPIDGVRVTLRTSFGVQRVVNGTGTICIESPYVAVGYHDRPDDTAAAFPAPGTYITTDRGRLLPGGGIEFAGRLAHQVKLRGLRIDLREIESVLATHPDVAKAAVALHEGPRGAELVGYVVVVDGRPAPMADALRAHLATRLPDYMLPAAVVTLPALPLGPTGKLDRRALPAPDAPAPAPLDDEDAAPRSPEELQIAGLWRDLLRVEHVALDDDFFTRGGHSLAAMRLLAQIERACGVQVTLRQLFERPTVRALAARVREQARGRLAERPDLRPGATHRARMLAPQRGTYIICDAGRTSRLWLAYAVWIDGPLDAPALDRALLAMRARHSVLRTRFFHEDGDYWQEVLETVDAPALEHADVSTLPEDERERADDALQAAFLARPWDLARGHVMRALVVRRSPSLSRLTVAFHHIVSDPQTRAFFAEELQAQLEGRELAPVEASYIDLVDYLDRLARSPIGERQSAYWRAQVDGAVPLAIPTDHPRGPLDARRAAADGIVPCAAANVSRHLGPTHAAALQRVARAHDASVMSVLLAAMAAYLTEVTGQDDISLTSGFQLRHVPGMERALGYFANPLLMRISTAGTPAFAELVRRTHHTVTSAYDHGDFDVLALAPHLFRMLFNYLYTAAPAHEQPVREVQRRAAPVPPMPWALGYDVAMHIAATSTGVAFALSYNLELFTEESATRLLEGYLAAVERVCATEPA